LLELGGPDEAEEVVLAVLLAGDHVAQFKAFSDPIALFAALR